MGYLNNGIDGLPYRYSCELQPLYTMTLQGDASVEVVPDIAILDIGVETINKNLKVAQEENAIISQQLLNVFEEMGIDESDIQTSSYNINKAYEYVDGKQIDKGYRVTHLFQVKVRNIEMIGEVIDAAVRQGANLIEDITFDVDNKSYYYQMALNLSLRDALNKAKSIGRNMGYKVMEMPLEILEESYQATPVAYSYSRGEVQTPIEPGQKQIVAKVRAVFSYQLYLR